MAISIPIFFYFDVSDGTLTFYRLQKLGVGETEMGVAQAYMKGIRPLYPMNPNMQILNI